MAIYIYDILSFVSLAAIILFIILTFKNKINFFTGVFSSTASMALSFILNIASMNKETGKSIIDVTFNSNFGAVKDFINTLDTAALQSLYGTDESAEIIKSQIFTMLDGIKDLYSVILPAVIILMCLSASYLTFMLFKNITKIFKNDVSAYPDFISLRMPKSSVLIFIISALFSIVFKNRYSSIFLNVFIILTSIFTVCGFSVILYFIKSKARTKIMCVLGYIGAFILTVFIYTFFSYMLVLTAVADSFLNLRMAAKKEDKI